MQTDELLLRRLSGQLLTSLCPKEGRHAASRLCGLQAQFLRNAVHALRIRTGGSDMEGLIKTWTLRGTVHLIPETDLPLYLRRCGTSEDVCDAGWYQWTAARGQANAPETERRYARMVVGAIADGIDTREALRAHMRRQGMSEAEEARLFTPWGGVIAELANVGVLAFRVDMADEVHPLEKKRYRLLAPFAPLPEADARLELARRYFTHYGPATLRDAAYFFHWTQAEIRDQLDRLPVESLQYSGRTHFWLPCGDVVDDLPPVRLLAGFDPLMLGYRKEDNPFLPPEYLRGIFNLAGIVHPAILLHGRVAGRWKEKDGKVELTAFRTLTVAEKRLVEAESERLFRVKRLKWT